MLIFPWFVGIMFGQQQQKAAMEGNYKAQIRITLNSLDMAGIPLLNSIKYA